jgi:SnoaL-like domain
MDKHTANAAMPDGLEIAERFLHALRVRDFQQIGACFHPAVRFRALVSPGVREGTGASEAIQYLRRWFGDADVHELLTSTADQVADRLHITYRFRTHDADGWFEVEQQTYSTIAEGRIQEMDLLCSGFRPIPGPAAPGGDGPGNRGTT